MSGMRGVAKASYALRSVQNSLRVTVKGRRQPGRQEDCQQQYSNITPSAFHGRKVTKFFKLLSFIYDSCAFVLGFIKGDVTFLYAKADVFKHHIHA